VIEIISGGVMSSVQDGGRFGYYLIGIPRSGPMDTFSFGMGNLLVRNAINEACIEVTVGFKMRALSAMTIAITGADLEATINRQEIQCWKTIEIDKNDILAFNSIRKGFWAYLCVAGGIDVPVLLESKSTYIVGRRGDLGFGGYKGRILRAKDIIKISKTREEFVPRKRVDPKFIPTFSQPWEIRVVIGPYDYMYSEESQRRFFGYEWKVSNLIGRIGYRYDGPALTFKSRPEYQLKASGGDLSTVVTDGVPIGGIQTPSGMPIVFTADSPTIGGYAKIGTVISADLDKVAQSKPGEITIFKKVELREAYSAFNEREKIINGSNLLQV
jgi:biotin-dependent carboxylase-like uncharacterized protein